MYPWDLVLELSSKLLPRTLMFLLGIFHTFLLQLFFLFIFNKCFKIDHISLSIINYEPQLCMSELLCDLVFVQACGQSSLSTVSGLPVSVSQSSSLPLNSGDFFFYQYLTNSLFETYIYVKFDFLFELMITQFPAFIFCEYLSLFFVIRTFLWLCSPKF